MTFAEYYKYYLTLHQNNWCRRLHFFGQIATILYILSCLYTKNYFLLFFAPFVVYPFAWSGHYYFERNKPAAFTSPVWAKASDWVMFKDIITGKIKW